MSITSIPMQTYWSTLRLTRAALTYYIITWWKFTSMWNESKLPSGAWTDQEQLKANISVKSTIQRDQPKQALSATNTTLNTQGKAMESNSSLGESGKPLRSVTVVTFRAIQNITNCSSSYLHKILWFFLVCTRCTHHMKLVV